MPQKFLVIQTAFIGDVVLATGIVEKLHVFFPDAQIDFLLRKGNEGLLANHPFINEMLIWDKKTGKLKNLWRMKAELRKRKYDKVINIQRFAASGFLTAFSGASEKIGFNKNPLSFLFSKKIKHRIGDRHETERNNDLIKDFTNDKVFRPALYPSTNDYEFVAEFKKTKYICISPASVWFTKQYPKEKWISFINKTPADLTIYLLGGPDDYALAREINMSITHSSVFNLCGKLNFLQSAALMKDAVMNYVNDSAPLHFASAINAPVTAVYCSTLPNFGFGPLSDKSFIVEIQEPLYCRPCGLHGKTKCPQGHFLCARKIEDAQLLRTLEP